MTLTGMISRHCTKEKKIQALVKLFYKNEIMWKLNSCGCYWNIDPNMNILLLLSWDLFAGLFTLFFKKTVCVQVKAEIP